MLFSLYTFKIVQVWAEFKARQTQAMHYIEKEVFLYTVHGLSSGIYITQVAGSASRIHFPLCPCFREVKVQTDLHTWILVKTVLPSIASVSFPTASALLKSVSFIQDALWPKRIPTLVQSKSERQNENVIFLARAEHHAKDNAFLQPRTLIQFSVVGWIKVGKAKR